ncbi:MAG: 4'-phosphopantetheinyl transferase family protein [Marmoricola sp.]
MIAAAYSVLRSPAAVDATVVLTEQVTALLGTGEVNVGRLCASCGSDRHGRPWARIDGRDVPVSLSRTAEHLLTVVAPEAVAVGVDVEPVDREWPAELVLAPSETADSDRALARVWVAKEAILKAYGTGLTRPMDELVVADFAGTLDYLDAPEGHVAAVALLLR